MKYTLVCILLLAASMSAQTPAAATRIVGQTAGGHLHVDPATKLTTDTVTLTFNADDGTTAATVEFVVRYASERRQAPGIVDVIVTEVAAGDERPQMQVEADGQPIPLIGRLRSRRSIVASLPFEDFVRLANADIIVQQAFGTELQFGRVQVSMLRSAAAKWSRR